MEYYNGTAFVSHGTFSNIDGDRVIYNFSTPIDTDALLVFLNANESCMGYPTPDPIVYEWAVCEGTGLPDIIFV